MAANSRTLDVSIQPQIPLFNGESYEIWSIKMKTFLMSQGLLGFVKAAYAESSKDVTSQNENERQDAIALSFIQQAVDESIFSKIATATSAKQAWSILRTEYVGEERTEEWENSDVAHGDAVISIQRLLDSVDNEKKNTGSCEPFIYMAPSILRDHQPLVFKPRIVAIGPLHRNDKTLQTNERQKATHMNNLLSRFKVESKKCVDKVNEQIDQIRACYAGTLSYSNAELAKMVVLDGCYILEFLYKIFKEEESEWGSPLVVGSTYYDLILLENQIPYFVLEIIFKCTISTCESEASLSLNKLIHQVLKFVDPFRYHEINIDPEKTHHHILDILQKSYVYEHAKSSKFKDERIPSATELDRGGVNFKPIRDIEWPLVMEMKTRKLPCCSCCSWGKPTLIMPLLAIDDYTELVFRNLIAYEQSFQTVTRCVSSYAVAMDMLIDTEVDVDKLVKSKVIVNHIGTNQDAANMINNICKDVTWTEFFYTDQYVELNRIYRGYWSRNIAALKRTYFNNPWNGIALFAALLLFGLTVVQTIFTVHPAN